MTSGIGPSLKKRKEEPQGRKGRESWRRAAVLACFLTSGATALAYEVVWVRMLTLVFGATVLSVGSVLAAYMAGLALGSWYWSRRADRASRPLRFYALLEFGIAGTALLTPWLFQGLQGLYRSLFIGGFSDFSALSAVRFLLCLPALLLPTFLMGGTLPVLARFYTTSLAWIGRGAGDLYAVNTLGAVIGTLLTGFVLIPALGVQGTLEAAVGLNALMATAAYILSLSAPEAPDVLARGEGHGARGVRSPAVGRSCPGNPLGGHATDPVIRHLAISAALVGFALSGFAAMIFEVAWTRALIQIFGNSTYAFTTMLACFLIGLALGAAVAGRFIDRARHPFFAFATLEFILGTWAAAATPLIEWLPPLFLRVYERSQGAFGPLQLLQFQACCLLMLPTTMGLGAVFPVVSKIFSSRAGGAGQSVGLPYAANTVGTVLGALAAGFLLLPRVGLETSIVVGAALNLLVWASLLAVSRQTVLKPSLVVALGLVGLLACAKLEFQKLDPQVMTAGIYMYPDYFLSLERERLSVREAVQMKKILYYREGYSASVAVLRLADGRVVLQTNGKTDASTEDLSTQRALAHLPMLLRPGARDVLVVGLASGCTAGSVLLYPVQRVDCVEIEPAMLEAAEFFEDWNHHCLQDERLNVLLQDARNYVMMSDRPYDVITAEPTNPWIAGVNNLFTVEYYRHCRARLKDKGIMCQWLPAYNFSEEELRIALATFASVFPHVSVWAFPRLRTDFFAIGSQEPLTVDPLHLAKALQGAVLEDLRTVGAEDLWRFAGGLLLDEAATGPFCRGARLNTDEHPLLEFSTPRHLYATALKLRTLGSAYAAGQRSQWTFAPEDGPAVLEHLGFRLSLAPGLSVTRACLVPHHPRELRPDTGQRDVAELRLDVQTPKGPAVLHAAPRPREDWPESLTRLWPEVSDPSSTRTTQPGEVSLLGVEEGPAVVRGRVEATGIQASVVWEVPASPRARERLRALAGLLSPVPRAL